MRKEAKEGKRWGRGENGAIKRIAAEAPPQGCQVRRETLGLKATARAQWHAGRVQLRQDRQADGLQGEKPGTKRWVAVLCLAKLEPLIES